jgi:hypothetical protein
VHISLTLWWFAGTSSAARGILVVLLLIALYRTSFPARAALAPMPRRLDSADT